MSGVANTASLPTAEQRLEITRRLSDLVSAIEAHPRFAPPPPHKSLYHVWDFVQRTKYVLSELDNITARRPLQHPDQFKGMLKEGESGPAAASSCFEDVVTRSLTVDMLVSKPTSLLMMGLEPIDFGEDVKAKAKAVHRAFPEYGS